MKKVFFKLIILLTFCSVIISCSVQKRIYRPGYNIDWNLPIRGSHAKIESKGLKKNSTEKELLNLQIKLNNPDPVLLASNSDSIVLEFQNSKPIIADSSKVGSGNCDTLFLNNGEVLVVKGLEITGTELRFKKCDNPNGPIYYMNKSEINNVAYSNGTHENFDKTPKVKRKVNTKVNTKDQEIEPLGFISIGLSTALLAALYYMLLFSVDYLFSLTFPYAFVLIGIVGLLAMILGITSLIRIKSDDKYSRKTKGVSVAGMISGIVITSICLVIIIWGLLLF